MRQCDPTAIEKGLIAHAEGAGLLVIHSALHLLGYNVEKLKWPLLRAIRHVVEQGVTVLVPAFTFSFTETGSFDVDESRSETGILAHWVLDLNGARRSSHPIYSFVAVGEKVDEVLNCTSATCFGKNSVFDLVEGAENSRILMIGADWEKCTLFHYYEEQFRVPYRHDKSFEGVLKARGKPSTITTSMYVRDLELNPQNDFSPAVKRLDSCTKIRKSNDELLQSAAVTDISGIANQLLKSDEFVFVKSSLGLDRFRERFHEESNSGPPFRLFIFGSQNNEILANTFRESWSAHSHSQLLAIDIFGYGQHREIFFGEESKNKKYDCAVCVERYKDLLRGDEKTGLLFREDLDNYINSIKELGRSKAKAVVVLSFSEKETALKDCTQNQEKDATRALTVQEANNILKSAIDDISAAELINVDQLSGEFEDPRLAFMGRIPFSQAFSRSICEATLAKAYARYGKTIRLLLVDLDNTCWGGVVGEEGVEGIKVGRDFPGNVYFAIQQQLKELSKRGIVLGILSKNDENLVRDVFQSRYDFALKLDDFVVIRANWDSKAENLVSIADEMGLGLQNIGFLDDNPVEREEVKKMLPEVRVLPWPQDITNVPLMLQQHAYLGTWAVTQEDLGKSKQYKNREQFTKALTQFARRDEFLRYLNVSVFLQQVDASNFERVIQLFAKTNQFNATGNRLSQEDIINLGLDSFIVIASSDRFSERENIGVIRLAQRSEPGIVSIEEFLLSCRALGKGIEERILAWVLEASRAKGKFSFTVTVEKRDRNKPIIDFYKRHKLSLSQAVVPADTIIVDTFAESIELHDERNGGVLYG